MPRAKRVPTPVEAPYHMSGADPCALFVGTPHSVLSQGSSKPVVFQLDDDKGPTGYWVVKAQCRSRMAGKSVLRELAGSDLCEWFGLCTPRIGLLRIPTTPPLTDDSDAGEAAAQIYKLDAGKLAFTSTLIDAPRLDVELIRKKRKPSEELVRDAITLFAMDALIWNFDRTAANPNTLLRHGRLVAIDHGHAFCHIDKIDESGCPPDYAAVPDIGDLRDHVARSLAGKYVNHPAWDEFVGRFDALTDPHVSRLANRWPDELDRAPDGTPTGWKADCARFLANRRQTVSYIVEQVRHALTRS